MAVPDFQTLMLPLLRWFGDGQVKSHKDMVEHLATEFALTEEDRNEMLPSGSQTRLGNRVAWARVDLGMAGLIESPRRGESFITTLGLKVLENPPEKITRRYLMQFDSYKEFQSRGKAKNAVVAEEDVSVMGDATPEELLEAGYKDIREQLKLTLREQVLRASPKFFEELVVELLLKMGYGQGGVNSGRAIGRSGDGGIDGVISEDRLGLENIYIQAKRWQGSVGRPEIQAFVGALHGRRARKGVFITSSQFTADALEYVKYIDPKVVLIDGDQLAEYMIELNVGVSVKKVYEIKRLDTDYFMEE